MRPQPLIAVHDVAASSRWYQRLLGGVSGHGGDEYEQLLVGGGMVLQLHSWREEHGHGVIGEVGKRPYGNGVLLWFETEDFDAAVERATELGAEVVLAPHHNVDAKHREIWVRDLDGYVVVIASVYGEEG